MPVDFMSEEQRRRYGRYPGEPAPDQLGRYFHLDDTDRQRIAAHRGPANRLGYALQLGTVRFLGIFLADPTDVPSGVIAAVAAQLGLSPTTDLTAYRAGEAHWDHAAEIKHTYGYRDFTDQPEHFRLVRWLYTRTWLSPERPSLLFDLATARLVAFGNDSFHRCWGQQHVAHGYRSQMRLANSSGERPGSPSP